jgi:glycerol-3-phosphate acyltransferase PlsY
LAEKYAVGMDALPSFVAALVFGYLCGSIPFGILLTRLTGGPDLRAIGSGNIGATNVLRTGRKGLAAATLLGDMLKGTAAVLITEYFFGHDFAIVAAVGAFLGHLFPVWLRFHGGKGVATYIGVLIGLAWPAAIVFCALWLVVAALSRYSSPAFLWWRGDPKDAALFLLLSVVLWTTHRANIARLLGGTEGRIGAGSKGAGG